MEPSNHIKNPTTPEDFPSNAQFQLDYVHGFMLMARDRDETGSRMSASQGHESKKDFGGAAHLPHGRTSRLARTVPKVDFDR